MTPDDIARCFTRADGSYLFARWRRPVVPVVFGVDDASLPAIKGGVEAVVTLAGHRMAETDPEQGANLMIFFCRDWAELLAVPDLGGLVPGLPAVVARLQAAGANQYRAFRFEADGAIRAAFVFLRMDDVLSAMPADALALAQAAQVMLLWSDRGAPAMLTPDDALSPEVARLLRAAYDPVLPACARDASHALRLAARVG